MQEPIILIGPMNVGKSTIGKLLSEATCLPQLSLDELRWKYYEEAGFGKEKVDLYIEEHGFLNTFVGKGVGTALLEATKKVLFAYNIRWVDIDCHEENKPSRGMMRKAGFKEVAIYLDVERRTVGSCNTWIGRCSTSTGISDTFFIRYKRIFGIHNMKYEIIVVDYSNLQHAADIGHPK